jgi:TetR/AcrR family transcriptional repressor of nem operon
MAALGGDVARQPEAVRAAFAAGVESLLEALNAGAGADTDPDAAREARARSLNMVSTALGAIILSRACPDDSPLADEILAVCRDALLGPLAVPR